MDQFIRGADPGRPTYKCAPYLFWRKIPFTSNNKDKFLASPDRINPAAPPPPPRHKEMGEGSHKTHEYSDPPCPQLEDTIINHLCEETMADNWSRSHLP